MNNLSVMFSSNDMTWTTPIELFNKLNNEFHFTLDVCATHFSYKCPKYFTPEENGLIQDWSNDICWMNPPYGKEISLWLKKAYEESLKGAIVVALIPSRTDTKYWNDYCMNAAEIRFIQGRLKFGDSDNSAPFPSAIIVFDNRTDQLRVSTYDRGYIKVIKYLRKRIFRYVY